MDTGDTIKCNKLMGALTVAYVSGMQVVVMENDMYINMDDCELVNKASEHFKIDTLKRMSRLPKSDCRYKYSKRKIEEVLHKSSIQNFIDKTISTPSRSYEIGEYSIDSSELPINVLVDSLFKDPIIGSSKNTLERIVQREKELVAELDKVRSILNKFGI